MEFKKAINKHKFDRAWYNEVLKLHNDHSAIMGSILVCTKKNTTGFAQDPLQLSTNSSEYHFDFDLNFGRNLSDECMSLFSSFYKLNYEQPPDDLDIQLQRIKDSIQANVQANSFTGMHQSEFGTKSTKSYKSLLSKKSTMSAQLQKLQQMKKSQIKPLSPSKKEEVESEPENYAN